MMLSEHAGVVVAACDYMEVQRLPGAEGDAVVHPPRPPAVADGIFHDLDCRVGIPVLGVPTPVGIALPLAGLGDGAVRVGSGEQSAVSFQLLDQRAEEGDDAAVVKLRGLRQEPGAGGASTNAIIRGLAPMASADGSRVPWPTMQIRAR